jgi:hypothetical protein
MRAARPSCTVSDREKHLENEQVKRQSSVNEFVLGSVRLKCKKGHCSLVPGYIALTNTCLALRLIDV